MSSVLPSYRVRFVHLVVVWAYSVSQPVFSMLDGNPAFLVVRGSSRLEIVMFGLTLSLAVPLIAVAAELLIARVSTLGADILHLLVLGLFAIPLILLVVGQLDPPATVAVLLPVLLATLFVAMYVRFRPVRTFMSVSVVLPVLGFVLFLFGTPTVVEDAEGAKLRIGHNVPLVVVVFDEFPVASILSAPGRIDSVRYPNFARLARESTWYPQATTVHDFTLEAIPAILTGEASDQGVPTVGDYPDNLFTLVGESYRVAAQEPVTYLCPKRYCPRRRDPILRRMGDLFSDIEIAYMHKVLPPSLATGLPTIGDRWGGFAGERLLVARNDAEALGALRGRSQEIRRQIDDFLSTLSPDGAPQSPAVLRFAHLMIPHSPWRFLPSGREYPALRTSDGELDDVWSDDPWLATQAYQRHLLQVGYTDRVLGRIRRALISMGVYDDSLLVVTADHGASFVPGGHRRAVTRETIADIARIPLFVKYPHQVQRAVDARPARTVDILPTIADVLEVRLPWTTDGTSLLRRPVERPDIVITGEGEPVQASFAEVERRLRESIRTKTEVFGKGRTSIFRIGLHRRLLGTKVLPTQASTNRVRIALRDEGVYEDVNTASLFSPALISGSVDRGALDRRVELAIAVNGRVRALTRCFSSGGTDRFRALVPPSSFRNGFNRIEAFMIESRRGTARLVRIGSNAPTGA